MEPKFQSSFIPKGPVAATNAYVAASARPHRTLFSVISTLMFVISLVLAVGLFGYDRYLLSHIGTLGNDLSAARTTLQPDVIKELVRTNDRIHSVQLLLANHTGLSPLLEFIEGATLKNVRFNQMDYSVSDKGVITLVMHGQAKSYLDVALQSDAFNKTKFIVNPVFSDLSLDNKGNVTFSFTATLDPSIVSYQKHLTLSIMPAVVATTTATSTATSTKNLTATTTATSTKTTTVTTTKTTATSTAKTATSTPH